MRDERLQKFADNLRAERNRRNISQETLAEMIGSSPSSISLIERSIQTPSVFVVYDIAKVLEIDINELFKGL